MMSTSRSLRGGRTALLAAALLAVACSDDSTAPSEPETVATLMVDASAGWRHVTLGDTAEEVSVAEPEGSDAWDLAFYATSVMVNGGAAGPAGVVGHCLCQNGSAGDAAITAMTAETELDAFLAVTSTAIPSGEDAWQSDALAPAIEGWYAYDPVQHRVSAASEMVWLVRAAETDDPAYAKFRVTGLEGATQDNAGRITIEYAVQAGAGEPMGATRTATIDVATAGRVHFDLARGEVSDASDWDLAFEGYTIRVNGGVSGSGKAGAVVANESFEAITDASSAPAQVYRADAFGGVFDSHPWYRYNLEGNHQVWPTYDVYLIKRGDEVFKVQLIGYYGPAGESRRITFRYARLTD